MHAELPTERDSQSPPPLLEGPSGRASAAALRTAIEATVLPIVAVHRCELVSYDWRREPNGWVLRLYVELLGHDPRKAVGGVTLEVCAKISRDVGTALDVGEVIDHAYHLEVSSPGLERPLAKQADWERFVGGRAKVQLAQPIAAHPGRKVFRGEIVSCCATLAGHDGPQVVLREDDLGEVTLPLQGMARAHLLIESRKPQPKPGKGPKRAHRGGPNQAGAEHHDDASGEKTGRTSHR